MIPLLYSLTLFVMLGCIGVVIIKRHISDTSAIIAVCVCLLYIIIGWVYVYVTQTKERYRLASKSCLVGSMRKKNGLLYDGCFDIWHVYHVVFWALIGLLSPNNWYIVVCLAVSWELTEHVVFKYIFGMHDRFCGRVEDVFLNVIGYGIGSMITKWY